MNIGFKREPLWWLAGAQGVVQALFIVLDSFHVGITSAQQAAITGLLLAVSTALGRSQVYAPVNAAGEPVAKTEKDPATAPPLTPDVPPPDEYADILANQHPESAKKSQEQLLADYKERQRRYGNLPPPIVKANE